MIAARAINIASYLVEMARQQPDAPALYINQDHRALWVPVSFRDLNDRSDAIAHGLVSLGIAAGTRTALCVRPGTDFFAVTFALFKLGAIPVLIDPGIGLKNLGRCLTQAQPTAFIGIPLVHLLRRVLGWAKKSVRVNISTGNFGGHALAKIQRMGDSKKATGFPLQTTDAAAILFTSGSTGPAKGVLYTHANFDAQINALRATYHIQAGEMDLATFPLFGLFGPALGMAAVIPEMDFTRPGFVDPRKIIEPIQQLGITNLFGSPALLDRVSRYGVAHNIKLPSLRRVISAGAPVPAKVLARFTEMLSPDTQIYTPFGATEALPVASIGSHEILRDTRALTDAGKGVCVGRPVADMSVRIIKITDEPIPEWSDDLELPAYQIGEIAVQGEVATAEYFNRPDATTLAKIQNPANGLFYHRMGDVGYFDDAGRLWFCGRKSQRVRLADGDLFSTPFEAIFNTHPQVARSALVGVKREGRLQPVICIERASETESKQISKKQLEKELLQLAQNHPHTRIIQHILFHPRFPVDIRHNAKINREQLTLWAQRKLK